ncbi:structure-specific endonuclease subunit SLX1 homolog [Selaginella moellendorffii]|uniref:structure-specific endonuclease subunit SLX1 homolog n=1 Tax=Selaginella moellendorffii TaxID=88036 RepID=UPI000D1CF2E1|nr:structure-specific endonuclease subunit SLX1 homolog [Selaginella moellendorffii]|eukprot:XP_024525304.1 structure-specific endonuclease subunit SLX1 homolog [Selaginella moellendorffii]
MLENASAWIRVLSDVCGAAARDAASGGMILAASNGGRIFRRVNLGQGCSGPCCSSPRFSISKLVSPSRGDEGKQAQQQHSLSRKISNDDLSRYGLDQSDFDVMRKVPDQILYEEDSDDWAAYLLLSADCKRTYVGITRNVHRRLRQHNGELVGGSKSGRVGRPWRLICTVRSFDTRSEASQFEYLWKSLTRTVTGFKSEPPTSSDSSDDRGPDRSGDARSIAAFHHVVRRRQAALEQVLDRSDEWKSSLTVEWHEEETETK